MKAQAPAQGILKTSDWGDAKTYQVICECTDPNCTHDLWVEADDHDVTVTIYVTTKTEFWSKSRWRQIWDILTTGYTKQQTTICLPQQVALNYAETLKSAVKDVDEFRKQRITK